MSEMVQSALAVIPLAGRVKQRQTARRPRAEKPLLQGSCQRLGMARADKTADRNRGAIRNRRDRFRRGDNARGGPHPRQPPFTSIVCPVT